MLIAVDEKTFTKEVVESSTPVLVNFWAPWCGLCRLVTPSLTRIQAEWGDQVKIVSINADENFRLSTSYRLTSLPTLLLFDRGVILSRWDQFRNREELRMTIETIQVVVENLTVQCGSPV
jgi:thioredoxin 1